ncbi:class I SAM-dependent methyltransferase [Geopsychrobacter electrodiphilus]|uniref:class I SAM-dependent methyltransferase n=1 Tax=Geopsychrobacter electrodiphilus TaxID=225196 RepID=UPI0003750606|nr:class I SAM-dependent methyltransferase [Geopsychrobacter electrodiphilus]
MNLYRSLVARFYDYAMRKVEHLCLEGWRTELLSEVDGDVLEIGAGTGVNLEYYSSGVKHLVLCEPDAAMRQRLERRLQDNPRASVLISPCAAERLDVADASIDNLVSTLVFCSVTNPQLAMLEAFRVLKSGGRLVLMEHVAANPDSGLFFWQRFWQPLWKGFACNCHLTRETAQLLEEIGFKLALRPETMRGAPAIAAPMIVGYAIRP